MWNTSTSIELQQLNGYTSYINSMAFSYDSVYIVSGSNNHSVWVWSVSMGTELLQLNGYTSFVTSVAFSHNSTRIIFGSYNRSVKYCESLLWLKTETLRQLHRTKQDHILLSYKVVAKYKNTRVKAKMKIYVAWNLYIMYVIMWQNYIWNASTGVELQQLNCHISHVTFVAFSYNGVYIVSGSDDHSVWVWQVGMLQCIIWYDTMNVNSVSYHMGSPTSANPTRW